jgi:rubrerythrin
MVVPDETRRTSNNLKAAVLCESAAYLRYQHLAGVAAVAGRDDHSQALRLAVAAGLERTRCLLDFLREVEEPPVGVALVVLRGELPVMLCRTLAQLDRRYGATARAARDDGLDAVAQWFETAVTTEQSRAEVLRRLLARLG